LYSRLQFVIQWNSVITNSIIMNIPLKRTKISVPNDDSAHKSTRIQRIPVVMNKLAGPELFVITEFHCIYVFLLLSGPWKVTTVNNKSANSKVRLNSKCIDKKYTSSRQTGDPRNFRTFYLRIRLFAVGKCTPKFNIRDLRFLDKFSFKIIIKVYFLAIQCSLVIHD